MDPNGVIAPVFKATGLMTFEMKMRWRCWAFEVYDGNGCPWCPPFGTPRSPLGATGRHWSQVDVACGDVQISSTRSPGMSPVTSLMLGEVSVETFQLTQTARSSPTGLQWTQTKLVQEGYDSICSREQWYLEASIEKLRPFSTYLFSTYLFCLFQFADLCSAILSAFPRFGDMVCFH